MPPKHFLRFFRWFCHPRLKNTIEGDLMELYGERVTASGKRIADRKFIIDVMPFFRRSIINPVEGNRTELAWWVFAAAGSGALAITLLTVSFQCIKAALANPVNSLRSE